MLKHTVIETRPYLDKWESLIDIQDTDTGRIYHEMFSTQNEPTPDMLAPLVSRAKERIRRQIEIERNDLNLTTDEDRLLDHYRGIKTDIILRIRQYPGATLQQAADYIAGKYPNSVFDFSNLYSVWLDISRCDNWAQFKQFCIDKTFEGVD